MAKKPTKARRKKTPVKLAPKKKPAKKQVKPQSAFGVWHVPKNVRIVDSCW